MVVEKRPHRLCDACGKEPAEQCTITTPEHGRRYVDLCAAHRQPLVELAQGGAKGDRRRTRSYTREQVAEMAKRKALS